MLMYSNRRSPSIPSSLVTLNSHVKQGTPGKHCADHTSAQLPSVLFHVPKVEPSTPGRVYAQGKTMPPSLATLFSVTLSHSPAIFHFHMSSLGPFLVLPSPAPYGFPSFPLYSLFKDGSRLCLTWSGAQRIRKSLIPTEAN